MSTKQQELMPSTVESFLDPIAVVKTTQREKTELSDLNNRLRSYIQQFRGQIKSSNMPMQIDISEELLKLTSVEQQLGQESNDWLKSLSVELEKLEDELKVAEENTSSLETQRKAAVAHNEQLTKQVKEFAAELDKFHSTLDVMEKSLEEEKRCKGSLQNSIESLKEELASRREVHKKGKQRSEEALFCLQRKLTAWIHSGGVEETDSQIKDGLIELREKRQEIVKFYSDKCKELEDTLRVKEKEIARICEEKARLAKDLEMVYGKNLEMDEEITIYRMLLVEWEGTASQKQTQVLTVEERAVGYVKMQQDL